MNQRYKSKIGSSGIDFLKKCLEIDQNKRWSVSKLLNHDFILEDNNDSNLNIDKVDLIRNNALNYNQDILKKNKKSTKDLIESSPDSIGHKSNSKNSPKYLNIKGQDHMFRTLRTSQQVKRKELSQENDKEFKASVGLNSKSNLRQTF